MTADDRSVIERLPVGRTERKGEQGYVVVFSQIQLMVQTRDIYCGKMAEHKNILLLVVVQQGYKIKLN